MVHATAADVQSRVPGIATSETGATRFIFDVLANQARNALLPDAVISTNLGQLNGCCSIMEAPL
ncbi:hypothetical protein KIN20_010821 [Parelaphostrongylus tenuis]|uniref:Uncharacterized protein n=1 Tax=Parelaphostrongylus tenuis TaxID=148309 RepID=A0AAD5MUI5_PARTN|nr:hypothetical protein KIN20_010821 [Parelaphostrongylus tenuis]